MNGSGAMKLLRRRFLHLAVGAVGLPAVSRIARAQTYPSRPVRIVVGAAAGGGTDIAVALTASSRIAPMPKRIFLVHPYFPAMAPIDAAFKQGWPEAQTVNLLDESLYADVPQDGTLSPLLYGRVATLLNHCVGSGADGIVFTGTTFGPAIEAVRPHIKVPLLRVEEAMAEQAVGMGRDILLVCSAKRAMPVIRGSLEAAAQRQNLAPRISELWVSGAKDALAQGGMEAHDRLIAREVEASGHSGTIVIGQISMVGAVAYLSPEIMRRTVTSLNAAVARMRALVER
jgi:Asp/Glu/hydantoin racemase